MKVQWLSAALVQLDWVYERIAQDNPKTASHVFNRIRGSTQRLTRFPESGRPSSAHGTRELSVNGLPYIVVYRLTANSVEILRVFHTSMDRPVELQ